MSLFESQITRTRISFEPIRNEERKLGIFVNKSPSASKMLPVICVGFMLQEFLTIMRDDGKNGNDRDSG